MFRLEDGDISEFGVVIGRCRCKVDSLAYGEWRDIVCGAVVHYVDENVFFGGHDGCDECDEAVGRGHSCECGMVISGGYGSVRRAKSFRC